MRVIALQETSFYPALRVIAWRGSLSCPSARVIAGEELVAPARLAIHRLAGGGLVLSCPAHESSRDRGERTELNVSSALVQRAIDTAKRTDRENALRGFMLFPKVCAGSL